MKFQKYAQVTHRKVGEIEKFKKEIEQKTKSKMAEVIPNLLVFRVN